MNEARADLTDEQYRKAAKRIHACDGAIEVDADAPVSKGDDEGAYVQAWVWISDEEAT